VPVYCLDRLAEPDPAFFETKDRLAKHFGGTLTYRRVDVIDADDLNNAIADIASQHSRMDGLIAAAGVQYVVPALEYPPEKIGEVHAQPLLP
jgi:NAD(P)-dependent dehydrogenase (short-subunit alcohol dehydrogenase family)